MSFRNGRSGFTHKSGIKVKEVLSNGKVSKLKGGDSDETFLVRYGRNKFVLRIYKTNKEADYYSLIHKRLSRYKFLPKLCYKEKNRLLFEYIQGRDCKKSDALKVAYQVGRICAAINQLKISDIYGQKIYSFKHAINIINRHRFFSEDDIIRLRKRYLELKSKANLKMAIDFDDVYAENFRIRKGKVYLVDIEGFERKFKGAGVAKSFLRWFKTPKQRAKFKRGYESIASMKFLKDNTLQFLYLNFIIFNIIYRLKRQKEMNRKDVNRLLTILSGKKI